jgi:hypothetical protein
LGLQAKPFARSFDARDGASKDFSGARLGYFLDLDQIAQCLMVNHYRGHGKNLAPKGTEL